MVRRHLDSVDSEEPVDPDRELRALGLPSLAAVGLLLDLEEIPGVVIRDEYFTEQTFSTTRFPLEVVVELGGSTNDSRTPDESSNGRRAVPRMPMSRWFPWRFRAESSDAARLRQENVEFDLSAPGLSRMPKGWSRIALESLGPRTRSRLTVHRFPGFRRKARRTPRPRRSFHASYSTISQPRLASRWNSWSPTASPEDEPQPIATVR